MSCWVPELSDYYRDFHPPDDHGQFIWDNPVSRVLIHDATIELDVDEHQVHLMDPASISIEHKYTYLRGHGAFTGCMTLDMCEEICSAIDHETECCNGPPVANTSCNGTRLAPYVRSVDMVDGSDIWQVKSFVPASQGILSQLHWVKVPPPRESDTVTCTYRIPAIALLLRRSLVQMTHGIFGPFSLRMSMSPTMAAGVRGARVHCMCAEYTYKAVMYTSPILNFYTGCLDVVTVTRITDSEGRLAVRPPTQMNGSGEVKVVALFLNGCHRITGITIEALDNVVVEGVDCFTVSHTASYTLCWFLPTHSWSNVAEEEEGGHDIDIDHKWVVHTASPETYISITQLHRRMLHMRGVEIDIV